MNPVCPYCREPSEETNGAYLYAHRLDLHDKKFYVCKPCGAYVGCHAATGKPLGTLANANLRKMRNACHRVFDNFWLGFKYGGRRKLARTRAYGVLAEQLGIPVSDCHIGQFDEETCTKVLEICQNRELFSKI